MNQTTRYLWPLSINTCDLILTRIRMRAKWKREALHKVILRLRDRTEQDRICGRYLYNTYIYCSSLTVHTYTTIAVPLHFIHIQLLQFPYSSYIYNYLQVWWQNRALVFNKRWTLHCKIITHIKQHVHMLQDITYILVHPHNCKNKCLPNKYFGFYN